LLQPEISIKKPLWKTSVRAVSLGTHFVHNQYKSHKQIFVLFTDIHEHLQRYVEKNSTGTITNTRTYRVVHYEVLQHVFAAVD